MSNKKSISLSHDEVIDILNCIDTSIIYLEDCKSRFRLLQLLSYSDIIDRSIFRIFELRNKLDLFSDKFNVSNFSKSKLFVIDSLKDFNFEDLEGS